MPLLVYLYANKSLLKTKACGSIRGRKTSAAHTRLKLIVAHDQPGHDVEFRRSFQLAEVRAKHVFDVDTVGNTHHPFSGLLVHHVMTCQVSDGTLSDAKCLCSDTYTNGNTPVHTSKVDQRLI